MSLPFVPPRQVKIGDAAAFVGTTPRAIRHYHAIGLLPEPERGADGRRRYGYPELVRLLWIRRMADVGIALEDVRGAFDDTAGSGVDDRVVAEVLDQLERRLLAQEEELRRQRTSVQRMRARGSRAGLLSDLVARRLDRLPPGFLRQGDLDSLLVVERVFGPLGAARNSTRHLALATDPALRERSDRVDAAEEALDDGVAVDDPRVALAAAERHAVDQRLDEVIEESGLAREDEALVDAWDAQHPGADGGGDGAAGGSGGGRRTGGLAEVAGTMPHDLSPARLRCLELALEMGAPVP